MSRMTRSRTSGEYLPLRGQVGQKNRLEAAAPKCRLRVSLGLSAAALNGSVDHPSTDQSPQKTDIICRISAMKPKFISP